MHYRILFILLYISCVAKHNHSNHFMHKKSIPDLIKEFESPERDAYQEPQKVIEYLGPVKNQRIMDLGSGSGYFSVKLAKAGANVVSADVNDDFLKYIKTRLQSESVLPGSIELRKIMYDDPLTQSLEFDKIFILNVYHHLDKRDLYLRELHKGLKNSGEIIIIDFLKKDLPKGPPNHLKIESKIVVYELEKAGFKILDVNQELLKYQYIVRAKK